MASKQCSEAQYIHITNGILRHSCGMLLTDTLLADNDKLDSHDRD